MRLLLLTLACFIPVAAQASKIAICDGKTYDITIINGNAKRVQTLAPGEGSIEEFGPTVSFQLKDQKPMIVTEPSEEFCIWSGKIKIQRRDVGIDAHGGGL